MQDKPKRQIKAPAAVYRPVCLICIVRTMSVLSVLVSSSEIGSIGSAERMISRHSAHQIERSAVCAFSRFVGTSVGWGSCPNRGRENR